MCSREIFTKKCRQQQFFDSDLKGAWHYNHVTFTPIATNFLLYCRLIYMLSILYVRFTINVKVGIPESFKIGWYPPKKTESSHLNTANEKLEYFVITNMICLLNTYTNNFLFLEVRVFLSITFFDLIPFFTLILFYRCWWNSRIFPFTKKSYFLCAQWRYYFYLSRVRILVSP